MDNVLWPAVAEAPHRRQTPDLHRKRERAARSGGASIFMGQPSCYEWQCFPTKGKSRTTRGRARLGLYMNSRTGRNVAPASACALRLSLICWAKLRLTRNPSYGPSLFQSILVEASVSRQEVLNRTKTSIPCKQTEAQECPFPPCRSLFRLPGRLM